MPELYLQGEHILLETVSIQHLEEGRILKIHDIRVGLLIRKKGVLREI